ncbi:MAG: hypothetical protein CMH56_15665 [Myxococcales bacterium]|nr:hypothetical protein [Myxococcales bacterium]
MVALCLAGCPNNEIPDPPPDEPQEEEKEKDPPAQDAGANPPPLAVDAGTPPPPPPMDAGPMTGPQDAGTPISEPLPDAGDHANNENTAVSFSGTVSPFHLLTESPTSDITVRISNVSEQCVDNDDCQENGTCEQGTCSYSGACYDGTSSEATDPFCYITDASGFLFDVLPPGSLLNLVLRSDNNPSTFDTQTQIFVGNESLLNTPIPYVSHDWFKSAGVDCGVYDDVASAPTDAINSHVVGRLTDLVGTGVANITQDQLQVDLIHNGSTNTNTHDNDGNGTHVCFLEVENGALKGSQNAASDANGYFAIFRLTNSENSTGVGQAAVRVQTADGQPTFSEGVTYLQAGHVGVVTIKATTVIENVTLVDFENEILPIFEDYGCNACHQPDGLVSGQESPLYLGGTDANAVYASLLWPTTTCEIGTAEESIERICADAPTASSLIQKPLYEHPPDHPNASFSSLFDAPVQTIALWIEQGAPRHANPTQMVDAGNGPDPDVDVTLHDVLAVLGPVESGGAGCTGCHYASRPAAIGGPKGGLALDGCVTDFDYAAVGIDANEGSNPNAQTDCAYYHFVVENNGARANAANPAASLLLTKPLATVVDGHPLKAFPNADDYRYQTIHQWINGGTPYDNGATSADGGTP